MGRYKSPIGSAASSAAASSVTPAAASSSAGPALHSFAVEKAPAGSGEYSLAHFASGPPCADLFADPSSSYTLRLTTPERPRASSSKRRRRMPSSPSDMDDEAAQDDEAPDEEQDEVEDEEDRDPRWELRVESPASSVSYLGAVRADGSSADADSGGEAQLRRLLVVEVRRHDRVLRVHSTRPLFVLRQTVRGVSEEDAAARAAVTHVASRWADANRALVAQFGHVRSRRLLASVALNREVSGRVTGARSLESQLRRMADDEAAAAALAVGADSVDRSWLSEILPPHRADAARVEDVYPLEQLYPYQDLATALSVDDLPQDLATAEELRTAMELRFGGLPAAVAHLQRLLPPNPRPDVRLAAYAVLMHALFALMSGYLTLQRRRPGRAYTLNIAMVEHPLASRPLFDALIRRFTVAEPPVFELSAAARNRVLHYILVLAVVLSAPAFEVSTDGLRESLRLRPADLEAHMATIGCAFVPSSRTWRLQLPSKWSSVIQRMRPKLKSKK